MTGDEYICFFLNSISFLAVICSLAAMKKHKACLQKPASNMLTSLREGTK
jgi:hypothetical protein